MDKMSREQRHKVMSHIKSKDTKIEIILRQALWRKGYRYRKNYKKLPGTPDIVFKKYKIAVFCDSEFFHGYNWAEKAGRIKTNRAYWIKKIERNMERDSRVNEELTRQGWLVIRFWGHEISKDTKNCIKTIEEFIFEIILDGCDQIEEDETGFDAE